MDSKSVRIYNPAKGNVTESRNVIFIETPPTLPDPAPASGLTDGEFTYVDNNDLPREAMDYTSYLDLDSSAHHGTVAPSSLDTDEIRQLVNNIRETTGRDLLVNTTSPASPGGGSDREVSSSDGAPTPDTGDAPEPAPSPAPAPAARRTERSTRSMNSVDEPSSANQRARNTSVNAKTVNELKRLALYTKSPLLDMGHCEERLNCLEYAYVANNAQMHSCLEGEKVRTIPNTFKEAMKLPEAKMRKAESDKEMKCLQDLKVYTLVPRSKVPPRTESDWVEVGLQGESRQHAQGAFGSKGAKPSPKQGLRRNLCSCLQTSEHPHGARHRR